MGRAERLIRYALDDEGGKRRGKTKIMTKWYLWQGPDDEMIRSVGPAIQAQFLVGCKQRLGVEKLDVVLLHRDDEVTPIETAIEALAKHQSDGHIDYIGASNYSLEHLQRAQKTAPLQNYQPRFSLLAPSLRDDGRLDFCREHSISIGCYGVVGQGRLAPRLRDGSEYPSWDRRRESHAGPKWERWKQAHAELQKVAQRHDLSVTQLAIAWVLSHPGITFAILGASNPEQAEHNVAASGVRLDQDVLDECEAIVQEGAGR
jgi:aryl-alcohol dehydrogenase-like predicted oxidoreductase